MTVTTKGEDADAPRRARFGAPTRLLLDGLGMLFLAGVTSGILVAQAEDGKTSLLPMLLAGTFAALGLACAVDFVRVLLRINRGDEEKIAPSVLKTNKLTIFSGALGALIAIVLIIGNEQSGDSSASFLTATPLPAWSAIVVITALVLFIPWINHAWHRSADEFDINAYRRGATTALVFYSVLAPCWWLAWRAGLAPQVDGVAIYFLTQFVWGGVWLWRKGR